MSNMYTKSRIRALAVVTALAGTCACTPIGRVLNLAASYPIVVEKPHGSVIREHFYGPEIYAVLGADDAIVAYDPYELRMPILFLTPGHYTVLATCGNHRWEHDADAIPTREDMLHIDISLADGERIILSCEHWGQPNEVLAQRAAKQLPGFTQGDTAIFLGQPEDDLVEIIEEPEDPEPEDENCIPENDDTGDCLERIEITGGAVPPLHLQYVDVDNFDDGRYAMSSPSRHGRYQAWVEADKLLPLRSFQPIDSLPTALEIEYCIYFQCYSVQLFTSGKARIEQMRNEQWKKEYQYCYFTDNQVFPCVIEGNIYQHGDVLLVDAPDEYNELFFIRNDILCHAYSVGRYGECLFESPEAIRKADGWDW